MNKSVYVLEEYIDHKWQFAGLHNETPRLHTYISREKAQNAINHMKSNSKLRITKYNDNRADSHPHQKLMDNRVSKPKLEYEGHSIDGKTVTGYGVIDLGYTVQILVATSNQYDESSPSLEWVDVAPKSVGRVTDLVDKNGNNLFEQDVVTYKLNNSKVVQVGTIKLVNHKYVIVSKNGRIHDNWSAYSDINFLGTEFDLSRKGIS